MAPLTPTAISFFEADVKDRLAEFDGDPAVALSEEERDAVSFAGALEHLMLTYCCQPELAGQQVIEFLDRLPRAQEPIDSFLAYATLRSVHERLGRMIQDQGYMEVITRDTGPNVDLSAAKDGTPSQPELDRQIGKSAQEGLASDADVAGSAWETKNPNKIHDAVRKSAMDEPKDDRVPDFRNMNPVSCFRISTGYLIEALVHRCVGKPLNAIRSSNPVPASIRLKAVLDCAHATNQEVAELIDEIAYRTNRLKPPTSETSNTL